MAKRHHQKVRRYLVTCSVPMFDSRDALRSVRTSILGSFRSHRKAQVLANKLGGGWPEGDVLILIRPSTAERRANPHRVSVRRALRAYRSDAICF